MSRAFAWDWAASACCTKAGVSAVFFRKEVIQPQVLLRLPCYDSTPIKRRLPVRVRFQPCRKLRFNKPLPIAGAQSVTAKFATPLPATPAAAFHEITPALAYEAP